MKSHITQALRFLFIFCGDKFGKGVKGTLLMLLKWLDPSCVHRKSHKNIHIIIHHYNHPICISILNTCEHFCPKPLKTIVPQIKTVEGVKSRKRALSDLKNMHNCKSLNFCQIEENYGTLFSLKMLVDYCNTWLFRSNNRWSNGYRTTVARQGSPGLRRRRPVIF